MEPDIIVLDEPTTGHDRWAGHSVDAYTGEAGEVCGAGEWRVGLIALFHCKVCSATESTISTLM